MTVTPLVPAVQYVRMSTEHQQYSTENQAEVIARYAQLHGFLITRTYCDDAKSGLLIKNRPALRQLLQDVTGPHVPYQAILVYDISRWGRFQDIDESAHYEFLCRSAGISVHYCAEAFVNDGSVPSSIMKALKRVMAGEYSRELGVKVLAGQRRLAELGFKQGGTPGLGYRRMLVSPDRTPKQLLKLGERKNISTDRVVLVPGPAEEVKVVQEIFGMFTKERRSLRAIARELNRRGILTSRNSHWDHTDVVRLLEHPRYIGCNVFNRFSTRLGASRKATPKEARIIAAEAHEAIVDPETFARAQEILACLNIRKSNEQILEHLRSLLRKHGRLHPSIVRAAGIPLSTLRNRFGGTRAAYELVGYGRSGNIGVLPSARILRENLLSLIQERFPDQVSILKRVQHRSLLSVVDGPSVAVFLLHRNDKRYTVRLSAEEQLSLMMVAIVDQSNFRDFYVFPTSGCRKWWSYNLGGSFLRSGKRFSDLSAFLEVVREVQDTELPREEKRFGAGVRV